ncbi:class I SAM-dependent methyltransferase [Ramlibacter sp. PS3R-8]|uniref:class I SAM-dependent methyltransferase n=1 Tax=Ramlibacter sp. PS3R-8 TaxID=3133437 RepID=UPI00309F52DB
MDDAATAVFVERVACISCGGGTLQEVCAGRFDEGAVERFIREDPWGEHPAPFLRGQRWSYVACQDCDMAFHRYVLAPDWSERLFSRWMSQEAIAAFEKTLKTPPNKFRKAGEHTAHVLRIEKLTRVLRGSQPTRVLDFGCGYGEFLSMCFLYGFDACGVDRSAAKRDNNTYSRVFAEIDDVAAMAPFHALTLFEVLEHLVEPQALMLRLRDLLATGGILVLETPDCSGVRKIETREEYARIHPLEHLNGFTPETLKGFAERLGFESITRPIACVTSDLDRVAKSLLHPLVTPTTRQYFRKR